MYVHPGQTDQFDILMNSRCSTDFLEFANALGWPLNIEQHCGFVGGLDQTYRTTGDVIRYYADATREVIFHDITLIPTVKDDPQQIQKKRHVGNDYVHIVWTESGEYPPATITSQFNAAHIIIHPLGNGLFSIRVSRKENVRQFGPLQDGMVLGKELLPVLVRETAINANLCCSMNISPDNYLQPFLRRKAHIEETIQKYKKEVPENFTTSFVDEAMPM